MNWWTKDRGEPEEYDAYTPPWLDPHNRLHHDDTELLSRLKPKYCYCCFHCHLSVCNAPKDDNDCPMLDCSI